MEGANPEPTSSPKEDWSPDRRIWRIRGRKMAQLPPPTGEQQPELLRRTDPNHTARRFGYRNPGEMLPHASVCRTNTTGSRQTLVESI